MAKTQTQKQEIQVKVLQNGFPIAETIRPLSRGGTISLSANPNAELGLPLYPLPQDIELLEVKRKKVTFIADQPWEGMISSRGTVQYLEPKDRSKRLYTLQLGDYANLVLNDLRVMVKFTTPKKKERIYKDRRFKGSLLNLIFYDRREKFVMALSTILGTALIVGLCFVLFLLKKERPRSFEELDETYTLPFIERENLATSPEALHENLDRRNYIASVVRYYRNVSELLMGWPVENPAYLFKTSVDLYGNIYRDYNEKVEQLINEQLEVDADSSRQKDVAILSIPAVYGETFQQRLIRAINKIANMHKSFHIVLNDRRQILEEFGSDPRYEWNKYQKDGNGGFAEVKKNTSNKEIAKISVFDQKTNEQMMYLDAERLGRKARYMQQQVRRKADRQENLQGVGLRPVLIPAGVAYASFLNGKYLGENADKFDRLEASEFNTTTPKEVKEPLVGQVEPKAIEEAIREYSFQLNLCYELALRRNQTLKGQLNWAWRIDSLGKISDIALINATLHDRQMINCVRREIGSWVFPKPRRGSVRVEHTFDFKPRDG